MIPGIILNAVEIDHEVRNAEDRKSEGKRSEPKGGIIFFGITFMIAGIFLDLFFCWVLFSYFKQGNIPVPGRGAQQPPEHQPRGPFPNQPAGQTNVPQPPNKNIRSNPGGLRVGGPVDEDALESKDPKVREKDLADIELSLNGGIDKNNDPADYNSDPGVPDGPSLERSGSDGGDVFEAQNRVVDRPKEANKTYEHSGKQPFPKGGFA
jgi:hypothetical protein